MSDGPAAKTFHASADAYDRLVGRYSPGLARELCAIAGVTPPAQAVDVGCGPGALTAQLVALLGADHVAAVDPSPPFVDACRSRHPGVRVEVGTAEHLPFDDGAFGFALAQLVINFMGDAEAGLREMRRVVAPGGTVAGAVWDYRGEMTLLRTFWDAAAASNPSSDAQDEGKLMRYCTPDDLAAIFTDAGLEDVSVVPVVVAADYDSFEDLWEPLESGVAPAGAYTVSLTPELRAALKDELRGRLGVGDDPFELTARAWVATGKR